MRDAIRDVLYCVGVAMLLVAVLGLVGLAGLWSLNTLFSLGLEYSLKNIIAATLLVWVVSGPSQGGSRAR